MDDELLTEVIDLALHWRYEHPGHAEINRDQQMVDGGELLALLLRHGIEVPMDFAMREIPAPGLTLPVSFTQRVVDEPLNYSGLDRSCDAYYGMGT